MLPWKSNIKHFRRRLRSGLRLPFKKPHNPTIPPDSDIYFPIELWLDIVSYLTMESIEALSLTCRSLRWIAQPLLFQYGLAIHPFLTSISYRRLHLFLYVTRSLERLEFISSPRIAHRVQEFSLTPYPRGHSLSRSGEPHIPENEIVDRVFDILPLFPNLKKLVIHSVKSNLERIMVLQDLPIQNLELETRGDDITWHARHEDTLPTPISARRIFSFNCNSGPHQAPIPVLVSLQFMYPESLEEIHSGPNGTESILTAMSASSSLFTCLRVLDISVRFVSSSEFVPALRQCPLLTTLRFRSAATDSPAHARPNMPPLPPGILPALVTYHGPPSLATSFAYNRSIRDMKLWSSRRASSISQPSHLVPIISQLGTSVELLEIGVTTLPTFLIDVIGESLPNLKSLSINTHLSSYHPGVPITRVTQTELKPRINIGVADGVQLHLDAFSFGVQLPSTVTAGSRQQEIVALEALRRFPQDYDPTSWDQWAIELPWSKITWKRLGPRETCGRMSIEYVEYENPVFRTRD